MGKTLRLKLTLTGFRMPVCVSPSKSTGVTEASMEVAHRSRKCQRESSRAAVRGEGAEVAVTEAFGTNTTSRFPELGRGH
jgi:hypothetical protein